LTLTEAAQEEPRYAGGPLQPIELEVARGLRFGHMLVLALHEQGHETVRIGEALRRLLVAKGILGEAEWTAALASANAGPAQERCGIPGPGECRGRDAGDVSSLGPRAGSGEESPAT
jgi:hypothetical protein